MPKMFGFLMKDLSKAFDWSDKKLPVAIIHTYGFDIKSIKFIDNYLARKKQDKNELIFQWVEWGSLWSTAGINIESPHHVRILYRKASQKLNVFLRVAHYMNLSQRKVIMKAFIFSHFGYCLLVSHSGIKK